MALECSFYVPRPVSSSFQERSNCTKPDEWSLCVLCGPVSDVLRPRVPASRDVASVRLQGPLSSRNEEETGRDSPPGRDARGRVVRGPGWKAEVSTSHGVCSGVHPSDQGSWTSTALGTERDARGVREKGQGQS